MWSIIQEKFKKHPAQEKVIRLILERGFQIKTPYLNTGTNKGRVVSGSIEIPHTQIAHEIGVDRRVVDATCETIVKDARLMQIFQNIRTMPLLRDVAPYLGLGVIVITPDDAARKGLLGSVATAVAEHGIVIRQAVSDDPYLTENPRLTIITEGRVSGELVNGIARIKGVKSVTVY
ncbi:MAG: amino acid-binding protein [Euryarchaeota archaeon]|nr:amino acid-binding protein [Euryarchaeota archaeon]